jgi:outer membrane protein
MNRLCRLILLWLLIAAGSSLAAELQLPACWSARSAVEFVLRNNPDIQIAGQRIRQAEALLLKAGASFSPQVGLSGSYTQTNNPMYSFGNILNQGEFTPGIDFNDPGRTDNLAVAIGAEYRFYNGGQDSARRHAAVAGVDLFSAEKATLQLHLAFEAFRSFQQIVEAKAVLQTRRAELEAIRSSLEVARARFAAGDMLRNDLLSLEVQESLALENQIQAGHNLELTKQIFLTLLGLPAGEVILDNGPAENPEIPANLSSGQRPETERLQAALRAAEAELEAAHGSRRPTLDGFASYQYDQGTVLNGSGDSWSAGLKLNFKLFDGHSAAADIALAEARLASLHAEQHKLMLSLGLEIRRAELTLSQAQQRLQVTQKMVEQAAESEQLSRARFAEGVILPSDLIDAETRLTDARVRNAVASSSVQIAIADLRRATGLPPFALTPNLVQTLEAQQ